MERESSLPYIEENRKSQIVRVSAVGIAANVALAAFKAVVGLISHSIAITLDAVNNLSDAASSAITIVGTKLAGKQPDRKHPYGHGRIEYLTAMVVSMIVLWAGVTSLVESVRGIMNPQDPSYDTVGLAIVAVAVAVKLVLGRYVKAAGRRLSADALVASGEDATFDAVISASTLVAALIYLWSGVSLEAVLGAVISLVIVKSGYEMLRDAIDKVLGMRVDDDLARRVKEVACTVDGVHGAYDLALNDYGPDRLQGSVHVEVDENTTAREVDRITREVQSRVYAQCGVVLHTVGIYSTNTTGDEEVTAIREALERIVQEDPYILQFHGLYVDTNLKGATFDTVVSFEAPDREAVRESVLNRMHTSFPGYAFVAVLDSDISD